MKKFLVIAAVALFSACSGSSTNVGKITEFGLKEAGIVSQLAALKPVVTRLIQEKKTDSVFYYNHIVDSLTQLGFQYKDSIAFYYNQSKNSNDSSVVIDSTKVDTTK